jgi:hypothetical protein
MSRKNDKIIVFGMIAIGVIAMAGVVAILGFGAYLYTSEKPTPTPAPTAIPTATATPVADLKNMFDVRKVLSDEAGRTYTLYIEPKDGAAPVDMSRLTVHVVADGMEYNVWDFYHGEHSSTGKDDAILNQGETFTLTVYLPQADVPMPVGPLMQVVFLMDGQTAKTINVTAV